MTGQLPNLHALALFVEVVERGSLSAAARTVGMHQPNASRAMTQLERQAGVTLLTRTTTGTQPTKTGQEFAERAKDVLNKAEHFAEWVDSLQNPESTTLRVGASMTVSEFLVPTWLTTLAAQSGGLRVDVEVGNSARIMDLVDAGKLELGLVETPHLPNWAHSLQVGEDELVVVISPQHAWAERADRLTLAELARTPLAAREQGSGTLEALADMVAQQTPGQELAEPAHVHSSNAAVRIAVETGSAPAVLSELAVQTHLDSGRLLRVPMATPLKRPLTAIWKGQLRPAAQRFLHVATN